jgi:hypothetical protein
MTTPSTPEPDPGPSLEPVDIEQPTFESFETPSFESISAGSFEPPPLPPPAAEVEVEADAAAAAATPAPEEPEVEGEVAEAEAPATETPTSEATSSLEVPGTFDEPESAFPPQGPAAGVPTFAAQSQSPTWASDAPSASETPAGFTAPHASPSVSPPHDNRRLILGLLGAVGALLLILVLILLYVFVIRDERRTDVTSSAPMAISGPAAESSASTDSETVTEAVAAPTADQIVDGPFTISVASTEIGDTISSTVNQSLAKTAVGEFFVVYLNVGNTSGDVQEFRSTLQTLNTDAGTIAADDEASLYLGGGVVAISAGEVVETAVAFDVPVGTVASGVIVHGVPGMAGGELPLE